MIRKALLTSSAALAVGVLMPTGASAQTAQPCPSPQYPGPIYCPPPPPPPPPPPAAPASRLLELTATRNNVRPRSMVRMRGRIEASSNPEACAANQPVELQRRVSAGGRFVTRDRTTSDPAGNFAFTVRAQRTTDFRTLVRATEKCLAAVSNVETLFVPPAVTVARTVARLTGGAIRFQLRCPTRAICSGTVKLRTATAVGRPGSRRRVTLGARAFQIPPNGRRTTQILIPRRVQRMLRTRRRVVVNVFLTTRGERGSVGFIAGRLILRTG